MSPGPGAPEAKVEDNSLPRSVIARIVKAKLQELHPQSSSDKKGGAAPQVKPDALLALQESAKVFISYIASTANDCAKDNKRQTIGADDVFTALEELGFTELLGPLRTYFEAHSSSLKEKAKRTPKPKEAVPRKRKSVSGPGQAEEAKRQLLVSPLPPQPPPAPPPPQPPAPSADADAGLEEEDVEAEEEAGGMVEEELDQDDEEAAMDEAQ